MTASSFHLPWAYVETAQLVEMQATLHILTPPPPPSLYYWAMSCTFASGAGVHTGLQQNPFSDVAKAINFGGYHADGNELPGTTLGFPSADNNPNTGVFDWEANTPYRFRIFWDSVDSMWKASVNSQIIRAVKEDSPWFYSPGMWSEVFGAEDDAQSIVLWSDLYCREIGGKEYWPRTAKANYNADAYPNVDSRVQGKLGWQQITNTVKLNPQGSLLRLEENVHTEVVQTVTGDIKADGRGFHDTGIPIARLAGHPFVNGDPNGGGPTTACTVQPSNYGGQIRLMFGQFTPYARPAINVPIYD